MGAGVRCVCVLTSLTSTSLMLRNYVHVAHAVVGSSGGGVGGGVLTFLTSTSLMLPNMYTLRMLSYDHQGGGVGVY